MGMSIPFAFEDRIKKGESNIVIWTHIVLRSIALIVMGLFHMNMEMYNHETSFFTKPIYVIISTSAFFMIWNIYPNPSSSENIIHKGLPIIGMLILIGSLLIYKGKSYSGDPLGFSTHWWGILGLIGWSYFIAASSYFIFRRSVQGLSLIHI